jgi:hypothetical protein
MIAFEEMLDLQDRTQQDSVKPSVSGPNEQVHTHNNSILLKSPLKHL